MPDRIALETGITLSNDPGYIKIAPYTPQELANMYGVSRKTFRTWLLPHRALVGERKSKYFTAKQTRIIFERLGEPG